MSHWTKRRPRKPWARDPFARAERRAVLALRREDEARVERAAWTDGRRLR